MTVRAIAAAVLLTAPLPLGAQGVPDPGMVTARQSGTLTAAHAAHEELHRETPTEPAVELSALERTHPATVDAEVLCRAAELALVAGLLSRDEADRQQWFREGERYAREAHALDGRGTEPLFYLAAAIGLIAETAPVRERIRGANEVLEYSRRILEIDPRHAGALQIRGRLSAAAMRTNPMVRFVVRHVMGATALAGASWAQAEADFRAAIAAEPDNPSHHIELAQLLMDTGRRDEAESHLERAIAITNARSDALAEYYRADAQARLGSMN